MRGDATNAVSRATSSSPLMKITQKAGHDPDNAVWGDCATNPSELSDSLMAIEGIPKVEVDPQTVVITV